jgi:hypothetical protein
MRITGCTDQMETCTLTIKEGTTLLIICLTCFILGYVKGRLQRRDKDRNLLEK